MFQHQGIWLPDGENHFPEWMDKNGELVDGRGTYQIRKFRAAMEYLPAWSRRVAVDVGAHVGFWSIQMLKVFRRVEAFEPVEPFRACWQMNVRSARSLAFLHSCALGAREGRVAMHIPALLNGIDSGGTFIGSEEGSVEMRTLDSFSFVDVDFIKIDCEGYEHHVIEGAHDTIERCRPVIIVEQKPHKLGPNFGIKGTPAVDRLCGWGYRVAKVMSGDYIMVHA